MINDDDRERAQLRRVAAVILRHTFDETYSDGKPIWSYGVQDAGFDWFTVEQWTQAVRLIYEIAGLLQRYVPDDVKREVSALLASDVHTAVLELEGILPPAAFRIDGQEE